jgi:hypothetical protein
MTDSECHPVRNIKMRNWVTAFDQKIKKIVQKFKGTFTQEKWV